MISSTTAPTTTENLSADDEFESPPTPRTVTGADGDDVAAKHDFLSTVLARPIGTGYQYKSFVREMQGNGRYKDEYDDSLLRVKITIVGAGAVGKTVFLRRFTTREPFADLGTVRNMTVRSDFYTLPLMTRHPAYDRRAMVLLWDTPGQTQYLPMSLSALIGTDGVILMFDAANKDSFGEVGPWRQRIETNCPNAVVLLAASRCDLYDAGTRQWIDSEIKGLAEDAGCDGGYTICSSKDRDDQIDAVFLGLIDRAIEKRAAVDSAARQSPRYDTVDLRTAASAAAAAKSNPSKKNGCGC